MRHYSVKTLGEILSMENTALKLLFEVLLSGNCISKTDIYIYKIKFALSVY